MKLKIPQIKKNKKETAPAEGAVFDLTGGRAETLQTADGSKKKTGRIPLKFRRRKEADNTSSKTETVSFGIVENEEDAFEVNVRNAEPILKPLATSGSKHAWLRDLQPNLACGCLIMAMLCLILTAADEPFTTLFVLPGLIVYLLISTLGSRDEDNIRRIRLYIAAALGVLLIVALVVLRKYIGNGLGLVMNQLYDNGEAAQAYVYDRFPVGSTGENDPTLCMWIATAWISMLIGLITALPPAGARRIIALAVAVYSMLLFAYYGLIPSWACIAAIAVGIIFTLSRGSLLSSLAVLAVVAVLFGAIMMIDPGESYGISRADEKFRDRFALKSAFLQSDIDPLDGLEGLDQDSADSDSQDGENEGSFAGEHKALVAIIVIVLILAAIGAAVWMMMKRIRQRRNEHRAGIDSSNPKEAITAMFPYAVRWLQPVGIDTAGKTFTSLVPLIRSDISGNYADRFSGMYELWKEAAYSDHEMSEENRAQMKTFLNDTISMIKERSDFRTRLAATLKYAL